MAKNIKGNKFDWNVLMRILSLGSKYKQLFIVSALLAIVLAPIGVIRPVLINKAVDDYIINYDFDGLLIITLIMIGVLILEVVLRYFFVFLSNLLGQNVIRDLRARVFNQVLSLQLRYFDQTPVGTTTTRTINDVESVNQVFTQGVLIMVADILRIFAVLITMIVISVRLTLIVMLTLPLMMIATYIFKEKVKIAYQKVRAQIARMNAFLQERLSGMYIVQIFNAEEKEKSKFNTINREYTKANLDSILYYAVFFPVVEIISALALALLVWWGAKGIISDDLSFGSLVVFPIFLNMLFRPMRMLADKINTLQMGIVAGERIFNLIDKKDKIENNGEFEPISVEGKISFNQVYFSYDGENDVLRDITFEINPGETLAVVGSTGSGKTTLINILSRFYETRSGEIKLDDRDVKSYQLDALRSRIGLVLQDVFLFSGTILDNIRMMDESIDEETVIQCAKMIGAHDILMELPNQYHFMITERGSNLSSGQRQLISFVRLLIFNPDVLILDEATSNIDLETENLIQYAIEKLISRRTSIIIAHRLSTIKHANKILVLDKGEIIEFGTFSELLEKEDGKFRSLYELQFEEI
ncbi:ABC transporter ATP-binding protein [Membranihabitans marinus]|uniref:ABC transporter ATP-binding protein n=1 Tax=Membranihabitans marinus TaxID=1227546 RepID=UPI001F3FA089|nr:ABC transporter ATP-binding protein [Membranihabitans marinus]